MPSVTLISQSEHTGQEGHGPLQQGRPKNSADGTIGLGLGSVSQVLGRFDYN